MKGSPLEYSDVRYLLAKRSVDDRALNRVVLQAFTEALGRLDGARPRVLELGAGVGSMVSRLSAWNVLHSADYTLLDRDAESLAAARDHLSADAARVRFVHEEATQFFARPDERGSFDLVMANAVLDLMDLTPALLGIWGVLKPGGLFWFTINFDAETIFLPEAELDALVMRLYHSSMDQRVRDGRPAGHSKTGRYLLTRLGETGARLLAAGSSDWVVFPTEHGYPGDEAYFLHHIVDTIDQALCDHPELGARFAQWVKERHAQIDERRLVYVAHQLDVFGTGPGRP